MVSQLRVFKVGTADAARVDAFYNANYDWHLMPRDLDELAKMVAAKEVFAVADEHDAIVGAAYLHVTEASGEGIPAPEDPREFGGILFDKTLRRTGVAEGFCAVVLGTAIASTGEYVEAMAHTHVANGAPHKLLGSLGFAPTNKCDDLDGSQFPKMRQSIDGKVWGVVHRHLRDYLAKSLAKKIRAFNGTLGAAAVPTLVDIEGWDKDAIADALDQLAK
jgi:hypothetical protein